MEDGWKVRMNICSALWSFVNFCCLSQSEVSTDNRKVSTFFAFQHVRCRCCHLDRFLNYLQEKVWNYMYWKYDKCMGLNTENLTEAVHRRVKKNYLLVYILSFEVWKRVKKNYLLVYILSFEVWEYHQTLQNMYLGCVTNFYYRN